MSLCHEVIVVDIESSPANSRWEPCRRWDDPRLEIQLFASTQRPSSFVKWVRDIAMHVGQNLPATGGFRPNRYRTFRPGNDVSANQSGRRGNRR
ncbi:hypothetical protein RBWH47_00245 [Rhodopirellula baltica WH47]|uniref:Uncharacterized protein n=1 Tax=Rhodopirellula baltica WH47 TaxID=991778 RepID=F2AT23_RHOBT|nr:hypothetical protein RBWH47_00245 [Rhodopirellula baltica WH47]